MNGRTDKRDSLGLKRLRRETNKNPLYLCMIDLRAAYDHVDRDTLTLTY